MEDLHGDHQPADAGKSQDVSNSVHRVDPRLLLASERTLLAWVRTSLALMGLGFLIARFGVLEQGSRTSASVMSAGAGVLLVLLGIGANLVAIRQHRSEVDRLRHGEELFVPTTSPGATLGLILSGLGLLLIVYLLTLPG